MIEGSSMETIILNQEKCIQCGKCVDECPSDVLRLDKSIQILKPDLCISCGHCAAICPTSTITCSEKNTKNPFHISAYEKNLPRDQELFHSKRSIRQFLDKEIEVDKITEAIKYAEMAPSSHNLRNREYLVVTQKKDIEQLSNLVVKVYKSLLKVLNPFTLWLISLSNRKAYQELKDMTASFKHLIEQNKQGIDPVFRNSKCLICISAPKGSTHSKDDCIAAQQYMLLFAYSIGIGSFIVGYAQYAHKAIEKYFKIRKDFSVYSVCAIGYAKNSYKNKINYPLPSIKWK
jgi:ferredoxin